MLSAMQHDDQGELEQIRVITWAWKRQVQDVKHIMTCVAGVFEHQTGND